MAGMTFSTLVFILFPDLWEADKVKGYARQVRQEMAEGLYDPLLQEMAKLALAAADEPLEEPPPIDTGTVTVKLSADGTGLDKGAIPLYPAV